MFSNASGGPAHTATLYRVLTSLETLPSPLRTRVNFFRHDLSALRELRTEPAVWRALVTTLVLRYTNEGAPEDTEIPTRHQDTDERAISSSAALINQQRTEEAARGSSKSEEGGRKNRTFDGAGSGDGSGSGSVVGVLSFRHERRLTLTTSCVLMGCVVPVSIFEGSRSDFWCEAKVPAALTSLGAVPSSVGMCVPKECIPLILDDHHPMRMRTILDASDLRHLSVLVADRLKLCRVGSVQKGSRSYHYWLDGAIGGGREPENVNTCGGAAAGFSSAEQQRDKGQPGQEFKLSLRKRSVGQVVFSRLVSFWVPSFEEEGWDEVDGGPTFVRNNQVNVEPGCHRSSPAAGHFVQRLVVLKEFAHRGECGELRGEVHDPNSGGPGRTFIPTPELTRTLLEDWRAVLKSNDRNRSQSARYWRESLTWRLRVDSKASCFDADINEKKADKSQPLGRREGTTRSPSGCQDDWASRMTLDERRPLFSLRHVMATLEKVSTKAGTGNAYFDLLILPPHADATNCKKTGTRKQKASVEFVATHRQTMAVFNFSVPAKALVKEFDAFVAAHLSAPTALTTELELPFSDTVLADLARKWLQYSPGSSQNGHRASLSISFPGTKAAVTEPYVGLRGSCQTRHFDSARKELGRPSGIDDDITTSEAGPEPFLKGGETPDGEDESRVSRGSTRGETGRRITRKSITTLQVETRNERMVFRCRLAVPRSENLDGPQNDNAPGRKAGQKQGGAKELVPKVLAISVYETFTAGSDGRIERNLRFCARDETVRPAVETTTTIPWVGTCEGVEGGKLRRVVTNGLSLRCTHDGEGKCVEMRLDVSAEAGDEGLVGPHHAERRNSAPLPSTLSLKEDGNPDDSGKITAAAAARGLDTPGDIQARTTSFAGNVEEKAEGERPAYRRGQTAPGNVCYRVGNPTDSRPKYPGTETVDTVARQKAQGEIVAPIDGQDSLTPNLVGGVGGGRSATFQGAERNSYRPITLYSGWHRITGVRLHVQCLQEEDRTKEGYDLTVDTHHSKGLADTTGWQPLGRGGATNLPCGASLRFLVCDPTDGYRTGVKVNVSDLCANLSDDGGIVEARLLDAGRRPALAKAIAQNLRLVFKVGGGYGVALPLPAKWNRSPQQAG